MSSALSTLAGVVNASEPIPGMLTAGQPGADHLKALSQAGVKTVIDIRDPMEPRPFDEPALVRQLGLKYVNVSVRQGALDDASMDAFLAAVRQAEGQPMLVHCASANRVAGALIPYFMLDRKMAEEDAVAEAMKVGLRGADLLEWGLEYSQRKAGG